MWMRVVNFLKHRIYFFLPPEGFLFFSVTVVDGCVFAYFSVTKRPVFADLFCITVLDFLAINLEKWLKKDEERGE